MIKTNYLKIFCGCTLFLFLTGCGTYFNQPISQKPAKTGEITASSKILESLPPPAEKVYVGVYNFKDQTGQYKNLENGSTFSTAVSQGSTSILIKALEDSKWFNVVERENIGNLLNERNIIRSTRQEYRKQQNPNQPNLPPLLYAGVLLEGGVVSYDSNIVTGGLGARYFGIGGSTQYREDRMTVYLRAVSTTSGRILKTVYVSKTILSQSINASLFRYVNFQRLLEVETGITKNEPVQLALKGAIEKAVESLIIEGLEENLWSSQQGTLKNEELIEAYKEQKRLEEDLRLYDRIVDRADRNTSIDLAVGPTLFDGDLRKKDFGPMVSLGINQKIAPKLALNLNGKYMNLRGGLNDSFDETFISADLNLVFDILPTDNFGPSIYAGGGFLAGSNDVSGGKLQWGTALTYKLSDRLGIRAFAEQNISFNDDIDLTINGKRNDHYYNFGLGVRYYFNKKKKQVEEFENAEEE